MARASNAQLADTYGELKKQRDALDVQLSHLEQEIVRRNVDEIEGVRYDLQVVTHTYARLVPEKLRSFLTPHFVKRCTVYDQILHFTVKDKHDGRREEQE